MLCTPHALAEYCVTLKLAAPTCNIVLLLRLEWFLLLYKLLLIVPCPYFVHLHNHVSPSCRFSRCFRCTGACWRPSFSSMEEEFLEESRGAGIVSGIYTARMVIWVWWYHEPTSYHQCACMHRVYSVHAGWRFSYSLGSISCKYRAVIIWRETWWYLTSKIKEFHHITFITHCSGVPPMPLVEWILMGSCCWRGFFADLP
jgi:hypothetical protein